MYCDCQLPPEPTFLVEVGVGLVGMVSSSLKKVETVSRQTKQMPTIMLESRDCARV